MLLPSPLFRFFAGIYLRLMPLFYAGNLGYSAYISYNIYEMTTVYSQIKAVAL
jgi:hypothetical protein